MVPLVFAHLRVCVLHCFSRVRLFETLWAVALQAPLSMGFSRQEYWRGLSFPSPGDLPDQGIEPPSLTSPAVAAGFFSTITAKPICSPSVALKAVLYLQVTSLLLKGKLFKSWSYDSRGRSQWREGNLRCWRRSSSLGVDPSGTRKDGAEGQAGMFSVPHRTPSSRDSHVSSPGSQLSPSIGV